MHKTKWNRAEAAALRKQQENLLFERPLTTKPNFEHPRHSCGSRAGSRSHFMYSVAPAQTAVATSSALAHLEQAQAAISNILRLRSRLERPCSFDRARAAVPNSSSGGSEKLCVGSCVRRPDRHRQTFIEIYVIVAPSLVCSDMYGRRLVRLLLIGVTSPEQRRQPIFGRGVNPPSWWHQVCARGVQV